MRIVPDYVTILTLVQETIAIDLMLYYVIRIVAVAILRECYIFIVLSGAGTVGSHECRLSEAQAWCLCQV